MNVTVTVKYSDGYTTIPCPLDMNNKNSVARILSNDFNAAVTIESVDGTSTTFRKVIGK